MRALRPVLLILLACVCMAAKDTDAQARFAGTWEAKFKDKVVCTIRLRVAESISGETEDCNISVDANGDLQEPESSGAQNAPRPIVNAKVRGDTLAFESEDGGDVIKFELRVVGDGQAELRILESPVPVKPIHFVRK